MVFSSKENENFLRHHCLPFQDASSQMYNHTMRRFPNYLIFFEFFTPVSKCGQNGGNDRSQLVVESWIFFGVSLIKQILMYLEMIFGKNKEQTTRQLQFKFDPLPTESTGICLFHQRSIKTFDTQPSGQLCLKYGLVFQKNDLVQFCNNYLVVPSQKKPPLGHSKNEKWFFRPKKMKTSLGNIVCHSNMHPCAQYEII